MDKRAPAKNIIQLRRELAERFPSFRAQKPPKPDEISLLSTGVPSLDQTLEGGAPFGVITEFVSEHPGQGAGLALVSILDQARLENRWAALVDGQDGFEATEVEEAPRFLWVRCGHAKQALKVTDLLLVDGSISLVILDLRLNPAKELRQIPSSAWHRLQRLAEAKSIALLVFTPWAMVSSARIRLNFESQFSLSAIDEPAEVLTPQVQARETLRRPMPGKWLEPSTKAEAG